MIKVKAPGRICLFGEHQDYLGYPVIAMSISKYIYLNAEKIPEKVLKIELPDIDQNIEIPLINKELEYESTRDYLRSGYNIFLRKGALFKKGFKIKITGDIPINAGCGSSSALVIAWLYFLNLISEMKLKSYELAFEGYNCEVREFNEAGGQMDHFTSVFGNLLFLRSKLNIPNIISYDIKLEGFVLGNSLEKKETVEDLIRVKTLATKSFEMMKETMSKFDPYTTPLNEVNQFLPSLNKEYQQKIIGNIMNRDITIKAKALIDKYNILLKERKSNTKMLKFYQELGNLLNSHQQQLKENIQVSTKKIDKMLDTCVQSGALGGKINGSGFGGTMFVLAPGREEIIKNFIENSGSEAYIVKSCNGVEIF